MTTTHTLTHIHTRTRTPHGSELAPALASKPHSDSKTHAHGLRLDLSGLERALEHEPRTDAELEAHRQGHWFRGRTTSGFQLAPNLDSPLPTHESRLASLILLRRAHMDLDYECDSESRRGYSRGHDELRRQSHEQE